MSATQGPLARLLSAPSSSREDAWAAFLAEFSDLIRFAIRKTETDPDAVGDAYVYVLERLRRDDFRRLRAFDRDGAAKFSTWLVVVVRRLAIDHARRRSRRRGAPSEPENPDPRDQLQSLASAVSDVERIPDERTPDPARFTETAERIDALREAVEELAPRDRLLLALRFQDGLSARAIADALSLPSQFHVYRRLQSLLQDLREKLEAAGIKSAQG